MATDLKDAPNVPMFGVLSKGDPGEDTLDGTAANLAGVVWLCGEIERVLKASRSGDQEEGSARLRQLAALLAANARPLLAPGEADRAFRSLVQHSIAAAQTTADELDVDPEDDTIDH